MSRFLFTSDIHLSPRPRDAYRWGIFKWLATQGTQREVDAVFLLGDLTDQKDNHSNRFINQVVDELRTLSKRFRVHLLKGNHDYSDPAAPLLRFLEDFHLEPAVVRGYDEKILLLPHTRKPTQWAALHPERFDLALCHQTFTGAMAETGIELSGISLSMLPSKRVISGDVHVPQKLGHLRYCGAPHPIRFGDDFEPRVLFWNDGALKSIPRTTIRKLVVECETVEWLANKADISEGDQVKVRLRLPRSRFGEWTQLRREVQQVAEVRGWELCGLELREQEGQESSQRSLKGKPKSGARPFDLFAHFCSANKIEPALAEAGYRILKGE